MYRIRTDGKSQNLRIFTRLLISSVILNLIYFFFQKRKLNINIVNWIIVWWFTWNGIVSQQFAYISPQLSVLMQSNNLTCTTKILKLKFVSCFFLVCRNRRLGKFYKADLRWYIHNLFRNSDLTNCAKENELALRLHYQKCPEKFEMI